MAWITLTEAQVLAALSGAEQAALAAQNTKDSKADPVPAIVTSVVREARSAVRAFQSNQLGPAGTIPDEMQNACLDYARYLILNQLPIKTLLTEQRIQAKKDALELFDKIAAGKRLIEQPPANQVSTEVIPTQGGGATVVRRSRDQFNPRGLRRL